MTDPKNPTPDEVVALLALRRERVRQKHLKPLSKWPMAVALACAVLFHGSFQWQPHPHPWLTLLERTAFLCFAAGMYIHINALTEKVNGLTELIFKD